MSLDTKRAKARRDYLDYAAARDAGPGRDLPIVRPEVLEPAGQGCSHCGERRVEGCHCAEDMANAGQED